MLRRLVARAGSPDAQARHRNPACLPEQLLCSAVGSAPARASARAAEAFSGQCAPQASARLVEPGFGEHPRRERHMRGLAGMRGAGERKLLIAEAEAIRRPALDQRQRLDRLDRRARENRPLDVAEREHDAAVRVDHNPRAAMLRFDAPASRDFDDDGIAQTGPLCVRAGS